MGVKHCFPAHVEQFDVLKVAVESIISLRELDFVRDNLRTNFHQCPLTRQLTIQLESLVAGRRGERIDIDESWPADWWEAFRERWFPVWWLRRWPVKRKGVAVHKETWRVCPHLNCGTVPQQRRHLEFLMLGDGRIDNGEEAN